jgi:uroporphyrinogen-III synthase
MRPLEGRRIGLLESRRADELASLVRRWGGVPVCAPSVREVPSSLDHRVFLERLVTKQFSLLILLTGAGARALFDQADAEGLREAVVDAMRHTTLACRGPKPLRVLTKHRLSAAIVTQRPHTGTELLRALEETPLGGVRVALVHYGERSPAITDAIVKRGGLLDEVCLYEWALPEDLEPLRRIARAAVCGDLDALLFTSQVQLRHLLQAAGEIAIADQVVRALRDEVVVGAVGPVCAGALGEEGIVPDVLPGQPTSVALVGALADYFELTADPAPST